MTTHTDGGKAGTMIDTHSPRSRRSVLRAGALGGGTAAALEINATTGHGEKFRCALMAGPRVRSQIVHDWLDGIL
jgi:hypothetical protein